MLTRGGRIGRSYSLTERLGGGELGEVWRARHEKINRECAIKFLQPSWELDKKAVAAFLKDAKASGQLGEPALVELLDQGEHEGIPYVVMPLLSADKLEKLLARHGGLAGPLTVRLVETLAHGVAAAHEQRVFHRRIEAANVLLHRDEKGKTIPKLIDFGIARLGSGEGQLLSPLAYLAPEQLAGEEGDGRADVWALATLLSHCVLGRLPFTANDANDLLEEIDSKTTLALEEIRRLDAPIASIVREGWTRDYHKRPTSKLFARKLKDAAMQRPGDLAALTRAMEIPLSLAPVNLHTIAPPKPPMPPPRKRTSEP